MSTSARLLEHNQSEATLRGLTRSMSDTLHTWQQENSAEIVVPPWKRIKTQPPPRPPPPMPTRIVKLIPFADPLVNGSVGRVMRGWPPPPPPAVRVQRPDKPQNNDTGPSHPMPQMHT